MFRCHYNIIDLQNISVTQSNYTWIKFHLPIAVGTAGYIISLSRDFRPCLSTYAANVPNTNKYSCLGSSITRKASTLLHVIVLYKGFSACIKAIKINMYVLIFAAYSFLSFFLQINCWLGLCVSYNVNADGEPTTKRPSDNNCNDWTLTGKPKSRIRWCRVRVLVTS